MICISERKQCMGIKLCMEANFVRIKIVWNEQLCKLFGTFEKRAPGARFSKVPKSFRARKAITDMTKILNLMFTELFFSHNFNTNKVNFHAKFCCRYTAFFFEIQIIKNGFTGPKIYQVFRETGPRFHKSTLVRWNYLSSCFNCVMTAMISCASVSQRSWVRNT